MRWMIVAVVLGCVSAWADADPKFTKLRDGAEAISSVSSFIEKYVGNNCGPAALGGAECEKQAEAYRKASAGKKFYMIATEEGVSNVLGLGEANGNGFTLNMTPLFAGSDAAITHGAPAKTDASGNPVMPYLRIDGTMPDGWNMGMLARQIQARALRIQVIFTPQGTWTLPKKGGGKITGVKARFDAVLIEVGRTGDKVGLWLAK